MGFVLGIKFCNKIGIVTEETNKFTVSYEHNFGLTTTL